MTDLSGRLILVTGASRGLGRAVAVEAARAGAHLILVARTQGALEELDDQIQGEGHQAPTLAPLDVTDPQAVNGLGAGLFNRFGRLDGWVHTAAELGVFTPVAHMDAKVLERVWKLSVAATQRLIASLDVPLQQSPAGRVVVATCSVGRPGQAFMGAYTAPRAAMEALVLAYAAETTKSNLKVNLVDPGPMETLLRRKGFPGEPKGKNPLPETLAPRLLPFLSADAAETGHIHSLVPH
ncbi:MAG: SDR family NAD(P)-dependent oxidoreductase [Geminicoccaceae bacterium]|nr:MAG: SDR family NAD(P)-dependent oxidoreductase [Geminicoccaceae bacterium]